MREDHISHENEIRSLNITSRGSLGGVPIRVQMINYRIILVALQLWLVYQVHFCSADFIDELYNLIFQFSSDSISVEDVRSGLRILISNRTGLPATDPRRLVVNFWIETAQNTESICSRDEDDLLLSHYQQLKSEAEQARQVGSFVGNVFNLETYLRDVRSTRLVYCLTQLGPTFIQELRETTREDFSELSELTGDSRQIDTKDANTFGRRVVDLILRKSDPTSIALLRQSSEDIDLFMEYYLLYSPCLTLFQVVDKYIDFYELIAAPEHYLTLARDIRDWLDRISACLFIGESRQVYESAAQLLFQQDHIVSAVAVGTDLELNNQRYDSIFRFGTDKMTTSSIKLTLFELCSYRKGLAADDPRRSEISYWIEAGVNDESKCNGQQDAILRSHWDEARRKAIQARQGAQLTRTGEALNLDFYVDDIMQDRLLYCESIFGLPFVSELEGQLKTVDERSFISDMSRGFHHTSAMDFRKLGERVGDLILENFEPNLESHKPMDSEQVKELYRKRSACASLIKVAERYQAYFSMISVMENYKYLSSSHKEWVDKLSVCMIIDQSGLVFEVAANYLERHVSGI